jgi:hypothetical protein
MLIGSALQMVRPEPPKTLGTKLSSAGSGATPCHNAPPVQMSDEFHSATIRKRLTHQQLG